MIVILTPRPGRPQPARPAVDGKGQAEIFAQRPALVCRAEQAAPLQFRDHQIDEVVERRSAATAAGC